MKHNLFKPKSFDEGRHAVVGDCNGITMELRYEIETPLFAKKIQAYTKEDGFILDYGCGVGRLAKEVLKRPDLRMHGTDASQEMLDLSEQNVASERYRATTIDEIDYMDPGVVYDTIYCVYVLQHCPAIEIRDVLRRIYNRLSDSGTFIYCSSDYRMAIRFDGKGFFDDRFLGVNLQDEISRFFIKDHDLFTIEDLNNEVLNKMILGKAGGLAHPAFVYHKKKRPPALTNPIETPKFEKKSQKEPTQAKKIVFVNDLSPGDVLLTSIAIRSLHKAYPGRFVTDMRSPCNELFMHNPYITKIVGQDPQKEQEIIANLKRDDHLGPQVLGDVTYIIAHYPEIHRSGMTGLSFTDGHRMFIAHQLGIDIPRTGMQPDLFLSHEEKLNLPFKELIDIRYWVLNAGSKSDYTLKQYPYYQEVVDALKGQVQFVQIGHEQHNHPSLAGVIDLRGKTNLRQLAQLLYHADGVVTPISLPMHMAAAFHKPCVVPAGAREGARWELYPNQRFLYYNGSMSCSNINGDGCWKSKIEDCKNKSESGNAMCMELIRPGDIVHAVMSYYVGGRLSMDTLSQLCHDTIEACGEGNVDKESFISAKAHMDEHVNIFDGCRNPIITSSVMNTLRILKGVTPQDTYFEAYKWHAEKHGAEFMDTYHFMWLLGTDIEPRRILEIGCRTGLSICQLLSAYRDTGVIERIVLIDLFNDGLCTPSLILKHLNHLNIQVSDKIEFKTGSSLDIVPNLNEQFDYILVDGCHDKDYARQDLINATGLINQGGYIVFDDLTPDGCNLQDVWDEFKEKRSDEFIFDEDHHGKGVGIAYKL